MKQYNSGAKSALHLYSRRVIKGPMQDRQIESATASSTNQDPPMSPRRRKEAKGQHYVAVCQGSPTYGLPIIDFGLAMLIREHIKQNETLRITAYVLVFGVLLLSAAFVKGVLYTPWYDVVVYCVIYAFWVTACLPWLLIQLDAKTLRLITGTVLRLFAADIGVLGWAAVRGQSHILHRGLRLKSVMEPSMSWLSEAGYSLRFGVVVASIVTILAKVIVESVCSKPDKISSAETPPSPSPRHEKFTKPGGPSSPDKAASNTDSTLMSSPEPEVWESQIYNGVRQQDELTPNKKRTRINTTTNIPTAALRQNTTYLSKIRAPSANSPPSPRIPADNKMEQANHISPKRLRQPRQQTKYTEKTNTNIDRVQTPTMNETNHERGLKAGSPAGTGGNVSSKSKYEMTSPSSEGEDGRDVGHGRHFLSERVSNNESDMDEPIGSNGEAKDCGSSTRRTSISRWGSLPKPVTKKRTTAATTALQMSKSASYSDRLRKRWKGSLLRNKSQNNNSTGGKLE